MTGEFRGKVAVVTGGGAGIGLAAAGRLAREGASVVICDDREGQAKQAAGGLSEEGLEVRGMRGGRDLLYGHEGARRFRCRGL